LNTIASSSKRLHLRLDGLAGGFGLFGNAFVALPSHLVRVPTDVPDELETLVRDILGNRRDEPTEGRRPARTCRRERSERQLAGSEDLEVAVDLRVHAGTVDDAAVGLNVGVTVLPPEGTVLVVQ